MRAILISLIEGLVLGFAAGIIAWVGFGVTVTFYPSSAILSPADAAEITFGVVFASILLGSFVARRIGIAGLPITDRLITKETLEETHGKTHLWWGIAVGGVLICLSVLVLLVEVVVLRISLRFTLPSENSFGIGIVVGLMAAIQEESFFRVLAIALSMWFLGKLVPRHRGIVASASIVLSTLAWMSIHPTPPSISSYGSIITVRTIQLFIGGTLLGALYVRKGFESCLLAHFVNDFAIAILGSAIGLSL